MAIIDIKNLSFKYAGTEDFALKNISLKINEGDFVVLAGESGSGKTTLLRCLKRELTPNGQLDGEILYNGKNIKDITDKEAASEIGYVMQNPESQIVTDKVWHELSFGLESLGYKSEVIRLRVAEMASFFGINNWFNKNTFDLSGGQKQLLNLASVMVMNPKILVLDEPTSQLDPVAASEFIATIKKINKELGLTVILSEHRLEEVLSDCDRAVILDGNQLFYYDKPQLIGEKLHACKHKMLSSMPSSVRLYAKIGGDGSCPLTVKEGRDYLGGIVKEHCIKPLEIKSSYQGSGKLAASAKNISVRYTKEGEDVVKNLDINIYDGEIYSLVGGNGSGKSTLIKALSGLKKAYAGKIKIFEKDIKAYKGDLYRHNVAVLPQNPQEVFIKHTVELDLMEMNKIFAEDKQEYQKAVLAILDKFSLTKYKDKNPYDLSGGEQQKAALCKVLLTKPKLLFLDEPTKGIDSFSKLGLVEIIQQLQKDGVTVFIVTHDLEFAALVSTRVGMLFDGSVVSEGTPTQFFMANSFYTTAANRISRGIIDNCVTVDDIAQRVEI